MMRLMIFVEPDIGNKVRNMFLDVDEKEYKPIFDLGLVEKQTDKEFVDVKIEVKNRDTPIKSVEFKGAKTDTLKNFRVVNVVEDSNNAKFAEIYSVDSADAEFDSAKLIVEANGKDLFKCVDWDGEKQECKGKWKKIKDITPGENYELTVTKGDPGFAEIGYIALTDKDEYLIDADFKIKGDGNKVDVEIIPKDSVIKKIVVNDFERDSLDNDMRIENKTNENGFVQSYSIDPTMLAFGDVEVTVVARGTKLMKCKDWDFEMQKCKGNWEIWKNGLVPGVEYTFTLTKEDPGYGEIVNISDAVHLDSNLSFISNIYDEVKSKDGVWSEPIYENEYVRIVFEENLTADDDIMVYVRNNQSLNTNIEVYYYNSTEKITGFPRIINEDYYRVYLTGMTGSHDTFDLKVVNTDSETAYLEFDHIIDPKLTPVQIFYETFPNADGAWDGSSDTAQDEPGWVTIQGSSDSNDVQVSNEDVASGTLPPSGGNHLTFEDCDDGQLIPNTQYDLACVPIDLDGYSNVTIEVYGQSDDVDANEWLQVSYSIDAASCTDGSWVQLGYYENPTDDTWYLITYSIPNENASANFRLRFASKSNRAGEHFYIDDVKVTGNPIPVVADPKTYNLSLIGKTIFEVGDTIVTRVNVTDASGSDDIEAVLITITSPNSTDVVVNASMTNVSSITNGYVYEYNYTIPLVFSAIGNWSIVIYANDSYSVLGRNSTKFTAFDTTAPSYVNLSESPAHPATYAPGQSYQFNATWTDNLNIDTVILEFDGVNYTVLTNDSNEYYYSFTDLAVGTYNYTWYANDTSNNWNSTIMQNYTINQASSEINLTLDENDSNITVEVGSYVNITATLVTPIAGYIELYNNGTLINSGNSPLNNYTLFSAIGIYNITAFYLETHNYSSGYETHYVIVRDTTAPIVELNNPTNGYNTSSTSINFNWTVLDNVDTNLSCNLTLDGVTNASNIASLNNTPVNYSVSTLNDGTHYWNVTCWDNSNNTNTSETRSFTIDTVGPIIELNAPIEAHNFSTNTINFNWTATDAKQNEITCNLTLDGVTNISGITSLNATPTNYTVSGLLDGLHYWNVTCWDKVNNTNTSATRSFIVDTVEPKINLTSPVNYYNSSSSNVSFEWIATDGLDSVLTCDITIDYSVNMSDVLSTNNTPTLVIVTGLQSGTHHWNVTCGDDAGNYNTSETRMLVVDLINPVINAVSDSPDPLNQTSYINITANVTDDLGVDTVLVDILGVNYTMQQGTIDIYYYDGFNTTQLGLINYTVYANDTAGNNAIAVSSNFTVVDVTLPVINSISDSPDPVDPGTVINITANVTDNTGVSKVWVQINGLNYTMLKADSETYYYDGFDTSSVPAGTHNYYVYANDTSGNNATPIVGSFSVNPLVSVMLYNYPVNFTSTEVGFTVNATNAKGFPMIIENEGNVYVNVSIKGTDMIGQINNSYTIPVNQIEYSLYESFNESNTLTTGFTSIVDNILYFSNRTVYFRISVPINRIQQTYQGNLTIRAIQS